MSDGYMREQADALAQHPRLTDDKSGYVKTAAEGFVVHIRKKCPASSWPSGTAYRSTGT